MATTYEYFINLDERGEFFADVRDPDGKTVFEFCGPSMFEDGFMRNKHDTDGLADYLIDLDVLKQGDDITPANSHPLWSR